MLSVENPQKSKSNFLPVISHPVNPDFVGLGHLLQHQRKQRMRIDAQKQFLQNRVLLLEKQHQRTNKEIRQKQKSLAEIIAIKKRQDEQKRNKQKIEAERMQELKRLKQNSHSFRVNHKQKLNFQMDTLLGGNRKSYLDEKEQSRHRESIKHQYLDKDLREKQQMANLILTKKQEGKEKILDFHKEKNKEHTEQYLRRIHLQEKRRIDNMNLMKNLQKRQNQLLQKLQKSNIQHKNLEEALDKAYDYNVYQLQQIILRKKNQSTKKSSRPNSNSQEPHLDKNLNKSQVQKSRIEINKLNLQGLNKKMNEMDQSKFEATNVQEHIKNINDDLDRSKTQRKDIVHRLKRNKHKMRYKNYEQF